jgi:hypothetical protein
MQRRKECEGARNAKAQRPPGFPSSLLPLGVLGGSTGRRSSLPLGGLGGLGSSKGKRSSLPLGVLGGLGSSKGKRSSLPHGVLGVLGGSKGRLYLPSPMAVLAVRKGDDLPSPMAFLAFLAVRMVVSSCLPTLNREAIHYRAFRIAELLHSKEQALNIMSSFHVKRQPPVSYHYPKSNPGIFSTSGGKWVLQFIEML